MLKSAHARLLDQHREESSTRAAAEEKAARLPDLESKLEQRDHLLRQQEARSAALDTCLIEQATLKSRVLVSARSFDQLQVSRQDKQIDEQNQIEKVPLDELMAVVEALCPQWPERGVFVDGFQARCRTPPRSVAAIIV